MDRLRFTILHKDTSASRLYQSSAPWMTTHHLSHSHHNFVLQWQLSVVIRLNLFLSVGGTRVPGGCHTDAERQFKLHTESFFLCMCFCFVLQDVEVTSPPDDSISCLAFSPLTMPGNFLIGGSWANDVRYLFTYFNLTVGVHHKISQLRMWMII